MANAKKQHRCLYRGRTQLRESGVAKNFQYAEVSLALWECFAAIFFIQCNRTSNWPANKLSDLFVCASYNWRFFSRGNFMQDFAGKVAVITGAASGIGKALSEKCIAEEMHVVMADIEEAALEKAAAELQATTNNQVLPIVTNVAI
jgi:hypothetical protein